MLDSCRRPGPGHGDHPAAGAPLRRGRRDLLLRHRRAAGSRRRGPGHHPRRRARSWPSRSAPAPTSTGCRRCTPDDVPYVTEAVRLLVAELGATPLIGFAGAPFTLASYLVEGGPSRDLLRTKALMMRRPRRCGGTCSTGSPRSPGRSSRSRSRPGRPPCSCSTRGWARCALADYAGPVQPASARRARAAGRAAACRGSTSASATGELLARMGRRRRRRRRRRLQACPSTRPPAGSARAARCRATSTRRRCSRRRRCCATACEPVLAGAGDGARPRLQPRVTACRRTADPGALARVVEARARAWRQRDRRLPAGRPAGPLVVVVGAGISRAGRGLAAGHGARRPATAGRSCSSSRRGSAASCSWGTSAGRGRPRRRVRAGAAARGRRADRRGRARRRRRPPGDGRGERACATAGLYPLPGRHPDGRARPARTVLAGLLDRAEVGAGRRGAGAAADAGRRRRRRRVVGRRPGSGRAVVDRLVEPLLGGVYAGHADRLSLRATVPQLWRRPGGWFAARASRGDRR